MVGCLAECPFAEGIFSEGFFSKGLMPNVFFYERIYPWKDFSLNRNFYEYEINVTTTWTSYLTKPRQTICDHDKFSNFQRNLSNNSDKNPLLLLLRILQRNHRDCTKFKILQNTARISSIWFMILIKKTSQFYLV